MGRIMPNEKFIPRAPFKNIEAIDRQKRLSLGLPVKYIKGGAPWGYARDPNDMSICLPNDKALVALYKAREYLRECSYADVANWLASCGFPITHQGLFKIMGTRPPFEEIMLPYEERMKLL